MEWHIGCSGFHYKHWKGSFYPTDLPQRRWFEFYAARYKTLELNVTFYRFPTVNMLQQWYQAAPTDFRFSVKAPRAITHFKQFHGTVDMLESFYGTIREGLQEKLGPVLFQFPPRFRYDDARLQRVTDQLDPGYANVLEFRHPGWWRQEVFDALSCKGVTFCGMSHPGLPDTIITNTELVYYRFHGVPDLYRSAYSEKSLTAFANTLLQVDKVTQTWCYFNNDAAVAAVHDAQTLAQLAALPPVM